MGSSGERVAMDLIDAAALVGDYRTAADTVGAAAVELLPLLREAAELTAAPIPSAAGILEDAAIELAHDADDLAWRVDYVRSIDTRFSADLLRTGYLPERAGGAPTWSASELARRLDELLDRTPRLGGRDLGVLLDALKEYTRRNRGEPRWDQIRDQLRNELPEHDRRRAGRLAGVIEGLYGRRVPSLADIEVLFAELSGQLHDPAYLARFFTELGPSDTLRLTEMIGTLGYAEALASDGNQPDYTADPIELRDMLSTALGTASQVAYSARHHGTAHGLSAQWFAQLFAEGVDHGRVSDGLPTLFATGRFRGDVARRAGEVALEIFDHRIDVRRGRASPMYEGFDLLSTHWEDRGGLLLGAAARDPEVASGLLLYEASSGRTGAQIIADRSYDNMNGPVVVEHFAALVRAGTIVAEDAALEGGVDRRAIRMLDGPWHAKAALIEAIASHAQRETREDPYPAALNAAFAEMVIHTMPHFVHVPPHEASGIDVYVDIDGDPDLAERIPSGEFGIAIPPYTAKYLLGALFRSEVDRARITDAAVLEQRKGVLVDPGLTTFEMVGRLEGALANGFIVAGMDDAEVFAREIEESNGRIDAIWDATEFAIGLLPGGGALTRVTVVATGAEAVDHMLDIGGVDLRAELLHDDASDRRIEARNEGQRVAYDVDRRARDFVFGRAFDDLRIEYAVGGLAGLSDRSRAVLDFMATDTRLRRLIGAGSGIARPRADDVDLAAEYDAMAWHFTRSDPGLRDHLDRFVSGLREAHPELAFD